jgi:hypothetical protein
MKPGILGNIQRLNKVVNNIEELVYGPRVEKGQTDAKPVGNKIDLASQGIEEVTRRLDNIRTALSSLD